MTLVTPQGLDVDSGVSAGLGQQLTESMGYAALATSVTLQDLEGDFRASSVPGQ